MKRFFFVLLCSSFAASTLAITHDPDHKPPVGQPLTAQQAAEVQKLQKVVPEVGDVPKHYELGIVAPASPSVDGAKNVGGIVLPRNEMPPSRSDAALVEATREMKAHNPVLDRVPEIGALLLAMAVVGLCAVKFMDKVAPYSPRRRRRFAE